MHRQWTLFLTAALFSAFFSTSACDSGDGKHETAADSAGQSDLLHDADTRVGEDTSEDVGVTPGVETAVCGWAGHEWLPPEQVGATVTWNEAVLTNLSPGDVDGLLAGTDFEPLGPARNGVRNFQLRYTTQDRGLPIEATAMVGIPTGLDTTQPVPVILWLHGTSGFMDECAPSTDPIGGAAPTTIFGSLGYVTVAPDFIGMNGFGASSPEGSFHHYLLAEQVAIGSLDSLRAALAEIVAGDFGVSGDPQRVVLLGGSQGGHACFFTERYAPHYAPEMTIVAVGAAVPPTNLTRHAEFVTQSLVSGSGNLAFMLTSMQDWYGAVADMTEVFVDTAPAHVASSIKDWMAGGCDLPPEVAEPQTLQDLYTDEFLAAASTGDWDSLAPWGCFLAENSIPTTSVPRISDTPFMVTYAENDTLVTTAIERENFPVLCAAGYRLEYLECAGKSHTSGAWASLPHIVRWLEDRLAGVPQDEAEICELHPAIDCEAN